MAERDQMNTGDPMRAKPGPGSVLPHLLTIRQAADVLGVSYWTVRTWVESGKLRAVRLPGDGRLVRIEIEELHRLIEECREN